MPFAAADAEEDRVPAHIGHVLEEVVVIGARRGDRTNVDTPAPVYVIGESALRDQGNKDLLDALRTVVPSFSVNAQPIADGATIVRPPKLRNLAADHTLVLVNGKRRHRGAVIAWLVPKASEGAQGPVLSVIPAIALQRVEVLRDGAAAQYGSDAIAGAMNFVLKDDREGGSVELRAGVTAEGDGARRSVAANAGFPLGDGFLNLSVEYGDADDTTRSVQRDDAAALIAAGNAQVPVPAQVWGSPIVKDDLKTFVNAALPLGDRVDAFAFGNFASKHTDGGFYYRNPHDRQGVYTNGPYRLVGDLTPDRSWNCPRDLPADRFVQGGTFDTAAFRAAHPQCFVTNELFPGGFTPRFGGDTRDWSVVAGLRGAVAALDWELSAGTGVNDVDFFIRNTVNAALGPHNPADFRFDPGAYAQEERSVQLDFAYEHGPARLASPLHIAFGAEWRRESFEIEAGDRASWINIVEGPDGPVDLQVQGFTAASNGFPGFSPDTAGRWQRSSHAAYVELDADVIDGWTVVAALRGETLRRLRLDGERKAVDALRAGRGLGRTRHLEFGFPRAHTRTVQRRQRHQQAGRRGHGAYPGGGGHHSTDLAGGRVARRPGSRARGVAKRFRGHYLRRRRHPRIPRLLPHPGQGPPRPVPRHRGQPPRSRSRPRSRAAGTRNRRLVVRA